MTQIITIRDNYLDEPCLFDYNLRQQPGRNEPDSFAYFLEIIAVH